MDGFQCVDEQLIGQRRYEHHDRVAAGRCQRAGGGIGHIAKGGGGSHNLGREFRGHGTDAAQGPGCSDGGNPGQSGDFSQGGTTSCARTNAGHNVVILLLARTGNGL